MFFDARRVGILAQKELVDAHRNRWFVLYTIGFATLSLAMAWFGLSGPASLEVSGFGRAAASMVNLVLLVVSLMGLCLGALSLAGERERGTLLYLLAQPVDQGEVVLGKFVGLATALASSLALGFGASGLVLALGGGAGQLSQYLWLAGLSLLLALATLGLGFLISTLARKASTAVGLALFVWLALVFLSDLGLMGATVAFHLRPSGLFLATLLNPLQVFKTSAVLSLRGTLELLGPAGEYAARQFGQGLLPTLVATLAAWTIIPMTCTGLVLRKKGAL